jgi:hypothetical protein
MRIDETWRHTVVGETTFHGPAAVVRGACLVRGAVDSLNASARIGGLTEAQNIASRGGHTGIPSGMTGLSADASRTPELLRVGERRTRPTALRSLLTCSELFE